MKKSKMAYDFIKPKKRSNSVLPFKYKMRILNDKRRESSNSFHSQEISKNLNMNKKIINNKISILKILLKDIHKYKYQNKQAKTARLDLRNIDIIKEKQNENLISNISSYLVHKNEKVTLLNKIKGSKNENLKKLLFESKSDQDILSKTFSTKFIGNEEYKNLSYAFEKGHSQKHGFILQYKENINDSTFRKTQSKLYKMGKMFSFRECSKLNSIKIANKKDIGISSKINYYDNQYDSYNSLMINRNLFKQLILNQEKEQIKQFLQKELQNEQRKFTLNLMPKIRTVEIAKFKKVSKKKNNNNESNNSKIEVNSIDDLSRMPRNLLISNFKSVYLKSINKFLSTPTCRENAKILAYLDDEDNNYKLLLFGGINVIGLSDLWECTITNVNKLEKKYIWKKVKYKGEIPLPRTGHSMVYYKNHLIIYGGIIEKKGGIKVKEDLLCYDIKEKKFSVEVCTNKFGLIWRSFHIAEILGQFMFIYGGGDENGKIISEPWALNLETLRWEIAKINSDRLPKRKFHCSCQVFPSEKKYNSKFSLFKVHSEPGLLSSKILVEGIYIFGGIDENLKCSNDILIIKRGKPLQLYKAIIKGRAPAPRCETTMNFFEKLNMLVIYGGKNENSKYGPYFNDMYFLDVETFTWIKIELNKNENFYPRGGHCACIVENEIIIFGGKNDKFLLKTDLLIGNLDIGESTKMFRTINMNKSKNKTKKNGKIEILNEEKFKEKEDEISKFSLSKNEDNSKSSKTKESNGSFDSNNILLNDPMKNFKKDAKIIMNQKVQTSKDFFLDFPKQKMELQEKFKEIDEINFNINENQKIKDIINKTFMKYNQG